MSHSIELTSLLAPVDAGLERMRAIIATTLEERSPAVADMTAHAGRFRGKQLRGALVLLAGQATGNNHAELPQVAAVVELIHLATLVHDDILDGASVRRRVASVNQRWDNQVAVLLGDFIYARAFALSTELSSRLCSRTLARTTQRLCVGEIEQSARRYDFAIGPAEVEAIAAAKTASLYASAGELGVLYPEGNPELAAEFERFGHEIGLAFQLVDDCLDLVGSEGELGKTAGIDVQDGKLTLPLILAYRKAGPRAQARIRDLFTTPAGAPEEAKEKRLDRLRLECDLEAGVGETFARARGLVEQARARLLRLPPSPARRALEDLGGFVLSRRF
jgi:octaprenyl-diphosphate synthase